VRKFVLGGEDEDWRVGVNNLVVSACVLRATSTKKVINFFEEKKCTPRENPGYAYVRVA